MTAQCISILGGSGFVGTHLIALLARRVPEIRVLTRRSQRFVELKVLTNVSIVETDVHDPEALQQAIAGSDAVINLVGILNQSGDNGSHSFKGAHVDLVRTLVDAMNEQGIDRLLHISALNASTEGSSEYLRSKGQGENVIREQSGDNLRWTLFRPSVIFGKNDQFFNRFAELLKALPVFPLACPDSRMAPVYVGDVCTAMLDALDDESTAGKSLDLCGPQTYTLRELVDYTNTTSGLNRRIVNLPDFAARLQATVMGWLPVAPFSRDNYDSLQTDSVCAEGCQSQPTSINAVVPRYIGQLGTRGRQQQSRRYARRDLGEV